MTDTHIMLGTIWFLLWGLLWAIYFVLDGFDLGMGTIMPFVCKDETDRRTIFNAAGPFWDGNEVWLLTAGGVTFAAFPAAYATMFSALYTALFLLLFALILRGVSFEFRSKVESQSWRNLWDKVHIIGSFLPALLFGVAFANIFRGIPINQAGINEAGLFQLLNPYGLAGGVLFVVMFAMHGSLWLAFKSQGPLHDRSCQLANKIWPVQVVITLAFVGYSSIETNLFNNYLGSPILFLIPVGVVCGLVLLRLALAKQQILRAWCMSALTIACTAAFGVIGIYPALLPSSLSPAYSMTIENSASSELTLKIMLGVALVMVPIVLAYQFWVYRLFSHKISQADLDYPEAY